MGQTPVVEQVAADEEGHEGAPSMHHEHEREDPNESPTLAGELGQALTYTPERSPTGTVDRIPGGHAPRIRCLPVSMDPIALLTSAVSATMVSVLLFVLPGAALGPLVLPDRSEPPGLARSRRGRQSTGGPHRVHHPRLDRAPGCRVDRRRHPGRHRRRPRPAPADLATHGSDPAPAGLVGRGPRGDCPGLRPRARPVIPGRQPGSPATELHHLVLPPSRPGDRGPRRLPGSARRNGARCARSPRTICR